MSGVGRRYVGRRPDLAGGSDDDRGYVGRRRGLDGGSDAGRRYVGRRLGFAVISDADVSGDDLSSDVLECAA